MNTFTKDNWFKIIIFSLLLVFLIIPTNIQATSGACSSHGGVYCLVGPSSDGSVICNDFSSDSTVYYWDTIECNGTINQILSRCPATGELKSQINNLVSQFYDLIANEFQNEINLKNEGLNQAGANARIITLRRDLGKNLSSVYKDITSKCQTALTQQADDLATVQQNATNQTNQQDRCPVNATLTSDNRCKCNDGYAVSGDTCITYNQICQNHYGSNAHSDGPSCLCNTGYQWNSSKTACVAIVCPINSFNSNGQCRCNFSYIMSEGSCVNHTTICKKQFGEYSYGDGDNCYCNIEAQWNPTKTACVKIGTTSVEAIPVKTVPIAEVKKELILEKKQETKQLQQNINDNDVEVEPVAQEESEIYPNIEKEENSNQKKTDFVASIFNGFKNIFKSIGNFLVEFLNKF